MRRNARTGIAQLGADPVAYERLGADADNLATRMQRGAHGPALLRRQSPSETADAGGSEGAAKRRRAGSAIADGGSEERAMRALHAEEQCLLARLVTDLARSFDA
jgi:hypothetical protein